MEDPALTEVIMYHVARREGYTHGMFFGQKIPTMHTAAPNIARAARAALNQGKGCPSAVLLTRLVYIAPPCSKHVFCARVLCTCFVHVFCVILTSV